MENEKFVTPAGTPGAGLDESAEAVVFESAALEAGKRDSIAALAYEYWVQRGCPIGSPEEDWYRAEAEIEGRKAFAATGG